MAKTSFTTATQTLKQLLGNGMRYSIPKFQRDYSWTQDEWEDLWQDIETSLSSSNDDVHYMGYLVLKTLDGKVHDVVDGQQRLTTLSLLALAVLKSLQDLVDLNFDSEDNRRRITQLRNTYIGYLDPVTLVTQSKLILNRRNDAYFQTYIVPLQKLPKARLRSDEQLRKAFEFFVGKIEERFKNNSSGSDRAKFLEETTDRLIFTVITVNDELNAFTVFETINARGVRLSPTDLLKNYLFSVVFKVEPPQNEAETLEQLWEGIAGRLGEESFPDFLRVYWNSRNPRVRESGLFKTIREKTKNKGDVFSLLRNMDEDVETFAALSAPESDVWNLDQKAFVEQLKLFKVRQPWSLLLAARRAFSDDDFTKILAACVVISFRYNIIVGRATGDQETVYNSIARQISDKTLATLSSVIHALAPIYPNDDEFSASFSTKSFRSIGGHGKKIVLYILGRIEASAGATIDVDSAKYNLEHILPQNPAVNWPQFTHEEAQDMLNRLGNCTILETSLNRDLGNSDFQSKKLVFEKSKIVATQSVAANNQDWNSSRIDLRQRQFAKTATSIWKISQLS